MKNFIILTFLLFMILCKSQSAIYTLGQSPINKPINCYLKDTNNILNKFVGTWRYESNGKIFTIKLQKSEMVKIINYFVDELNGNYKLTDGNLTIVDTNNYPVNNAQLTGARLWEGNPNKVSLFFFDPERPRVSSQVTLTYSNQGGIEKLHWELKIKGIYQQKPAPGVSLNSETDVRVPKNIFLTKQ